MNRTHRRARRQQMAADYAAGGVIKEIAARFDVDIMTVYTACREFGVPIRSKADPKWAAVDWSKPDAQLAVELGRSVQRINQKRKEYNARTQQASTK